MKIAIVVIVISLAFGFSAAVQASSDETAVTGTINQFIDAFNKGDIKSALASCAEETLIIDEFPPHEWRSCAKWSEDFDADAKKNGITDGNVNASKPRHVDITNDRAYVVVPVGYTYKKNGTPMKEENSTMTVVLQKGAAGWRITAWAWAKN